MTDIEPPMAHEFSSKYLMVEDCSTKKTRRISYYKVDGRARAGVVFIPGFMANKEHTKSIETLKYCLRNDIQCIRSDEDLTRVIQSFHFEETHVVDRNTEVEILPHSQPSDFHIINEIIYDTAGFGDSVHEIKRTEARFTHWLQDAREVLLKLTDGPQIVVGSSMGGWISMILAQEIPEKFAGLLLLAPAYNFGEKYLQFIEVSLPQEIKEQMRQGLVIEKIDPKFPYYGPVPVSYDLFEGVIPYNIPLEENKININIPVRIFHGTKDEIIPCKSSEPLIDAIKSDDVILTTLKGCTHELSDPKALHSIFEYIGGLLKLASPK